jgi:hypothetical protein
MKMHCPSSPRTLAVILLVVLANGSASSAEGERIPDPTREVWLGAEARLPCLRGTMRSEMITKIGQKAAQTSVTVQGIKFTASAALLELQRKKKGQRNRWVGRNTRYTFSVSKPDTSDGFLLEAFAEDPDKLLSSYLPRPVRNQILDLVLTSYSAGDVRGTSLLDSTSYRIERNLSSPDRPSSRRFTFHWIGPGATGSAESGWFDADPSLAWAITAGEFTRNDGGRLNTYRYKTNVRVAKTGVAIPVEREISCLTTGQDGSSVSVVSRTRYELEEVDSIPESEFSLSAFGLPEPVGAAWDKPTPRYVWFLVGAAVFAFLTVGLRLIARRRAGGTAGKL